MKRILNLDVYRIRDVIVALLGIVVFAPVGAVVAGAIRLDSGGPVLFRQQRVGREGRVFHIHKFRTMHTGHEGLAISTSADPRITRVGRILRATKLDELPQLIDVIRGDMAIVGPRPEVPQYVDRWPPDLRTVILSVRPGITDPASIVFRHEGRLLAESADPEQTYVSDILPRKASLYAEYVRGRSFGGDLILILQTLVVLFMTQVPSRPQQRKIES